MPPLYRIMLNTSHIEHNATAPGGLQLVSVITNVACFRKHLVSARMSKLIW